MSKLVPELRFKEFSEEWEEKELIDICEMQAGKFVQASDIYNNNSSGLYPCFGGNGLRGYTKSYTHFGNYPLIGRQGELCGNINFAIGQFHATEHAVVSTPRERINTLWLYYLLINLKLNQYATGQAQPGLSVKVLEKVEVLVPKSEDEQQKIANCLSSLDSLIEAQNKKVETLKEHKKGLMQQLFPSEGETVPKLRFDGFSGEWDKKPINDILTIGSGRDYKHLSDGDIPVYGTGGYMLSVDSYLYDGESVCIGRKGTIDKPMFLKGKFWTVDTLFYTHSFKENIPRFIYLLFQKINWYKYNEASGVPSLSKVTIGKINIFIPKPKEQQKIANCLSSLDNMIEAQNKKVETLKEHKKGLMQQLFVSSEVGV